MDRGGVVIGGGHHVTGRHAPRAGRGAAPGSGGPSSSSMKHSVSDTQMHHPPDEDIRSLTFNADDFPSVNTAHGRGGSGMAPVGLWSGMSATTGGSLRREDFPSLPKQPKGKAGSQHNTMAAKMAVLARPVRVLNKANNRGPVPTYQTPAGSSSTAATFSNAGPVKDAAGFTLVGGGSGSSGGGYVSPYQKPAEGAASRAPVPHPAQAPPEASAFPSLGDSFPTLGGGSTPKYTVPTFTARPALSASLIANAPSTPFTSAPAFTQTNQAVPVMGDFPSLPVSAKPGKNAKSKSQYAAAFQRASAKGSKGADSAAADAGPAQAVMQADDFPSLGGQGSKPGSATRGDQNVSKKKNADPTPATSPALKSQYAAAFQRASTKGNKGANATAAEDEPQAAMQADDFPSLGPGSKPASAAKRGQILSDLKSQSGLETQNAAAFERACTKGNKGADATAAEDEPAKPIMQADDFPSMLGLKSQLGLQTQYAAAFQRASTKGHKGSDAAAADGPSQAPMQAADFPSLGPGSKPASAAKHGQNSSGLKSQLGLETQYAAAFERASMKGSKGNNTTAAEAEPAQPIMQADDFPSMLGLKSQLGLETQYAAAFQRASTKGNKRAGASAAEAEPAQAAMQTADFPSLGQVAVAVNLAQASKPASATKGGLNASKRKNSDPTPAAAISATPQGGVSESLKAANRALIEKIKQQLTEREFAAFKQQTELASLCPMAERRKVLIEAHKAFLASPSAHDSLKLGDGWVPPEAAIAAAKKAEEQASWRCATCTLINAPHVVACEACSTPKGGLKPVVDDYPTLGAPMGKSKGGAASSSSQPRPATTEGGKGKGKSKGVKVFAMPGPGRAVEQWPVAVPPKNWD
eukprot:gene20166-26902_t